MPRKNKHIQHVPYTFVNHEAGKTRFATRRQAEEAAAHQMLIKPELTLYVYKSDVNGGWYLTRSKSVEK